MDYLADMFPDNLYRRMADLGPTEQAILQEVVDISIRTIAQRTPAGYEALSRQNEELERQLRSYKRKLVRIEKAVEDLEVSSVDELNAALQRLKSILQP